MRRITLVLVILLVGGVYIFWRKENFKDEEPFKARVVAVYQKNDGNGYAIVLNSLTDRNVWTSAVVTEIVKEGDIVTVDRGNERILYNDNMEGTIIKKR